MNTGSEMIPQCIRNAIENLAGGEYPGLVQQLHDLLKPYFPGCPVPSGFTIWAGADDAPVEDDENVDLQFRDGSVHYQCMAGLYSWRDSGMPDDIVAYKISGPNTPWTWSGDELPPLGVPVIIMDDPAFPMNIEVNCRDRDWVGCQCWWMHIPPLADGTPSPSKQAQQAITFIHEISMGAYRPEEIEARAIVISRIAPLEPELANMSQDFNQHTEGPENLPDHGISESAVRILDSAFNWAESRVIGPTPAKYAWRALELRIEAELQYTRCVAISSCGKEQS